MNDLNEQYFKTKETHRKSVKKNAWITWGIIVLLGLTWIVRDIYKTVEKKEKFSEQSMENQIENFSLVLTDTIVNSDRKDFRLLIMSGLYFGYVNDEMPIMVISRDSTDLILYIKRTQTDKRYDSLIKQWESKITQTDSTYKFTDIEKITENDIRQEIGNVKLIKNNKEFKGKILIVENGMDIYIVQGISNLDSWEFKKTDIQTMINSFKIE